MVFNNTFAVIH